MGVDTGEGDELWIERSGAGCRIVDDYSAHGVTGGGSARLVCSGAHWDGSGWLLGGCGIKIWLPYRAPMGAPIPEPSPSGSPN